jgi:precorrin-3B synthase
VPPSTAPTARPPVDACPGVLSLHEAADGGLARIRIPGGALDRGSLVALVAATTEFGDGALELTSRANVQIRGIDVSEQAALASSLTAAGLLPSASHERVRNIVASPLAGLDARGDDVSDLVAALDRDLCARAVLADLPGRFLFAIDDGRGDVAAVGADVTLVSRGDQVLVESVEVPRAEAVAFALALAEAFLVVRAEQGSSVWRIAELEGGVAALLDRVAPGTHRIHRADGAEPPVGVVRQSDGRVALVVLVPFGRLLPTHVTLLTEIAGDRGVRFTPWRSVVVPDVIDAAEGVAAAAALGLGVDADSPWYRVSACTGRPGCPKALADVRADATAQLVRWPGKQVRWSGCERRCGRPHDTDLDVIATADGYRVVEGSR